MCCVVLPNTGAQLADILVRLTTALNAQEIPNVNDMLSNFNHEVCVCVLSVCVISVRQFL